MEKTKASNFSTKFEAIWTSIQIYTSKSKICGCSQFLLSTKSEVLRYKNKLAIVEDNMPVGNEKLVKITCAGFQMFLEVGQCFQSSM
jgi:hypothetical protein